MSVGTLDFKNNKQYEWLELHTKMIHPSHEIKQGELFAHYIVNDMLLKTNKPDELVELQAGWVAGLLNSQGIKNIQLEAAKQTLRGHISGYILYMMSSMVANGVEASLNKSIALAQDYFSTFIDAEKNAVGLSATSTKEYWLEFRSVSHYWAAYHLLRYESNFHQEMVDKYGSDLTEMFTLAALPGSAAEMTLLFPISDFFLNFGCSFKPKRSRKSDSTFLNTETTWQVPKEFEYGSATIEFAELPDFTRKSLARNFKSLEALHNQ